MQSLRVRIPGFSNPVVIQADKGATASQVLETIAKKYQVPIEGKSLVVCYNNVLAANYSHFNYRLRPPPPQLVT